jgi:putative ABC transport system substrate-binding protein
MRRREFITLAACASVARPLAARAQQPAISVIGWLNSGTPRTFAKFLRSFQQGLGVEGYVEGRNLMIKYCWAEGHFDELDALAAELVTDRVTLIAATGGIRAAQSAKGATATIPIVVVLGGDPVRLGLVTSFNKPGGNVTGITVIATEPGLVTKRLKLLYDLDPEIRNAGALVNPEAVTADIEIESEKIAASSTGRPLIVLKASSAVEIEAAFASAIEQQVRALVISADPFFMAQRAQIVRLAADHKLLVMYAFREFVDDGGLMSYGPSLAWAYREAGIYAGRILKGAKPSELPIQRPVEFKFLINLKTAKTLGLTIPGGLLAIADEVIE